jgi:hypothetical protein
MPFDATLQERLSRLRIRSSENDLRYLATYELFLNFFRQRIAVADLLLDDAKIAVVLVLFVALDQAEFTFVIVR